MPVLLVRHAHALSRSGWAGDDKLRDLSDRGRAQAEGLVDILREYKPQRLVSSPYRRCIDTLAPLAAALNLEVEPADELAEGSSSAAVRLVRRVMGEDVVLCSHGDVIPDILARLADEGHFRISNSPRNEKASTWVLGTKKGRFVKPSYIRPPQVPG